MITVDLSSYIETRFFGQRPHVRGRRVPVATLAHSAQSQGWDVPELAHQFGISDAEVLAVLLYYEQHHEDIEQLEAEYRSLLEATAREHGA